jgi:flagellar motility protein MotE (MotC chaperone)
MIRILQSGWMTVVLGALTYLAVTAVLMGSSKSLSQQHTTIESEPTGGRGPSWDFSNPEVDRLIAELNKEKQALATREQQLNELATRLQAERSEINQVTQTVFRLQQEFDRNVLRVREDETANLRKLAKIYSTMTPEGATLIIRQLEDEEIAKMLVIMKESEAAPLLENLAKLGEAEAKRAAALSERLRKSIRRTPSDKQ